MDSRNFEFMFYGFAAAWAVIALYVIYIASREAGLRKELDQVRRMIEGAEREHEHQK